MKRLMIIVFFCLTLIGCCNETDISTSKNNTSATSKEPSPTHESIIATQPENSHLIYVYIPNETLDGFCSVETIIPELSPCYIIEALIEAKVLTKDVSINSISMEDSKLYLDFNEGFNKQLNSFGTTGEWCYMGSIVNTFLYAYRANYVLITVNGQIVESGHVIYDFPMRYYE